MTYYKLIIVFVFSKGSLFKLFFIDEGRSLLSKSFLTTDSNKDTYELIFVSFCLICNSDFFDFISFFIDSYSFDLFIFFSSFKLLVASLIDISSDFKFVNISCACSNSPSKISFLTLKNLYALLLNAS